MSEKASSNDPGSTADAPRDDVRFDIPVEPGGGDEIDPLPKWWDESVDVNRSKVENRRIEDGIEVSAPRRKALRSIEADEPGPESEPAPALRTDPLVAIEAGESTEPQVKTPPPISDIDFGMPVIERKPGLPEEDPTDETETTAGKTEPGWLADDPVPEAPPVLAAEAPEEAPLPDEDLSSLFGEEAVEEEVAEAVLEEAPVESAAEPETEASLPELEPVASEEPEPPVEPVAEESAPEETVAKETVPDETVPDETIPNPAPIPAPESLEEVAPAAPVEAPAVVSEPTPIPAKAKKGCWTVFATLYFFATILLLLAIVGGAIFARSRFSQLGGDAVETAKARLAEQGLFIEQGNWSYAFPRGVVFEEVTLFDDSSKTRPALKISDFGVNVDVFALATTGGGVETAEFSLHDSTVTLYEGGNRYAELTGAEGEVLVTESMIEVKRLSARVGGLQVRLRGGVKRPETEATPAAETGVTGEEKKSALAAMDFSALRRFQPWLGFEGIGDEVPVLDLSFSMDASDPGLAVLDGSFRGGKMKWQTLELAGAAITFRVDPASGTLRFPQVLIQYGGGSIDASMNVDTATQTLKIESLLSNVDLITMLSSYDPAWATELKAVRFVDAPVISVKGEVPMGDPSFSKLEVRYTHPRGLVWTTGSRDLPLSDIRGDFKYDRGAIETNNATAELFGGRLEVNGATNLLRDTRPFTGLVEITGMELAEASKWSGQESDGLDGRLSLVYRGTGTSELATINGGGNLRIEEADLTGFPLVGEVRTQVGAVLPNLAKESTGTLTGAYIIESGVLVTSDLTLLQGGLRTVLNGSVNLVTSSTSFVAKVDLAPELAAATGLEGKAVAVEGGGTLQEPVLKVREFPLEFASGSLGGLLGSSPESLQKLKDLVKSEDASKVISGSLEEAAKIGVDPAVVEFLKAWTSGAEAAPAAPLRAVPQN